MHASTRPNVKSELTMPYALIPVLGTRNEASAKNAGNINKSSST